jgi:hypothetical protein
MTPLHRSLGLASNSVIGGATLMRVSYVRISTNEKGASCFEDCYSDLAPGYAVPPAPPLFSKDFTKAGQCFWIGAPPTWGGQVPHPFPRRQIFVTVSGEYEVSVGDGVTRRFPVGSPRSRRHDRHGTFNASYLRAGRFRFRGHDGRIDRIESLVGPVSTFAAQQKQCLR